MKKIFFMALSITILLSTITFISCSEKEDTSMEKNSRGENHIEILACVFRCETK